MLDHVGLAVADVAHSKRFYAAALGPLGYTVAADYGTALGFGAGGKADFWIALGAPSPRVHVAFQAADRATVRAFYEAALAAGGRDNGAPGERPHYHASYYGAFVLDPDGHNVEAVCHTPE